MQSHGNGLHMKTEMFLSPFPNTIHLALDFRTGVVENANYTLMTCKKIGYVPQTLPSHNSLLISQNDSWKARPSKFLQKVKSLLLLIFVYLSLHIET